MRTRGRINTVKGAAGISNLTGDVVGGPGTGAVEATIPANIVTYAQQQDVSAASRLLGRGSDFGAGDPEEIALGTGLTMTDRVLSSSGGGGGTTLTFDDDLGAFTTPRP